MTKWKNASVVVMSLLCVSAAYSFFKPQSGNLDKLPRNGRGSLLILDPDCTPGHLKSVEKGSKVRKNGPDSFCRGYRIISQAPLTEGEVDTLLKALTDSVENDSQEFVAFEPRAALQLSNSVDILVSRGFIKIYRRESRAELFHVTPFASRTFDHVADGKRLTRKP